jgi:hydrogenase nickel incorporation protein HypB
MCTTCGCADVNDDGRKYAHETGNGHGHHHAHDHERRHVHDHAHVLDGTHNYGGGLAGVHLPGMSQLRIVQIERDILSKNDEYAAANRARIAAAGVFALNLVSSPGSGKTALLVRAITDLRERYPIVVIEGDQQTANDAERIRATGAPAIQVNTGKGCHLDAHMVGHALDALPLAPGGLLFIENVGNLVCPAAFDLGEAHKIVVHSVTEGEDKPLKYPDMFAAADLMLINKVDLVPHVEFDLARTIENARRVNPRIEVFVVSARTGEGMPNFYAWIAKHAAAACVATKAAD